MTTPIIILLKKIHDGHRATLTALGYPAGTPRDQIRPEHYSLIRTLDATTTLLLDLEEDTVGAAKENFRRAVKALNDVLSRECSQEERNYRAAACDEASAHLDALKAIAKWEELQAHAATLHWVWAKKDIFSDTPTADTAKP